MMETLKENLGFIGVCLLVFAGLFLVALAAQKFLIKEKKKLSPARYVAYIGMFAALAGVLMLIEIPLFFAPSFYKMDLSEIPVLICTFSMGPVAGVVCELIKVIVKLLLKGTTTAFVGDFANFVVGCAMVLPASIIYHMKRTKEGAVIGLMTGGIIMTVFGSLFNAVYLLPAFSELYGIPLDVIVGMGTEVNSAINSVSTLVLFAVVPFNVLKSVIVSIVTMLLYKRVKHIIKLD
ncbi:MAG: ECF transporter S component [Oscillospiraceae bacterium]